MMKGLIHREDITVVNTYAPNTGTPTHIKQLLTNLKGKLDNDMIIIGGFKAPTFSNGYIIQTENQ